MMTTDVPPADVNLAWMLHYLSLAANAERDGYYQTRGRYWDRMAQKHYIRYLDKIEQAAH